MKGAPRLFPKALAWVVPLSIATYFIPTFSALAALDNWHDWKTGFFPELAALIGGKWLGIAMTAGATVMQVSILNRTNLASTREHFDMAENGYISSGLSRLHPRFGTPMIAILVSCLICCVLAQKSLAELISVYIWLRIPTSLLTVLCAAKLHASDSTFRIPWGRAGRVYVVGAPLLMSPFAMIASDRFALKWGLVALATGPLAWLCLRRREPASASV